MHEWDHRTELLRRKATAESQPSLSSKQNLRLLIALSLLLVALVVVLVKDHEFWFGSYQVVESDAGSQNVAKTAPAAVAAKSVPVAAPVATAKNHNARTAVHPAVAPAKDAGPASTDQALADQVSPVVATNRVALPPLDVEVVAGDTHRTVRPGSNVAKVEIPGDSNHVTAAMTSLPTKAAARERISAESVPELRQTVDTTLPLLGQHMKVQGSVVLQAVIGADGNIENLSVLSGPAILATAAQQAVRQWRFKPYLQNGQPVETKTRITVNFSIRVADNPAKTS